jgi:hypothetical protein
VNTRDLKRSVLTALALTALAACSGGPAQFTGQCTADTDCGIGAICRVERGNSTGLCICRPGSDEACAEGEFCNSQGVCQARPSCRANSECPADRFCDLASGECIERTKCGTDAHCDPNSVCDPASGTCVDGCRGDGDCRLYWSCVGASGLQLGRCASGVCSDKSFCEFGQFCANGSCQDATNPDFCVDCGRGLPGCQNPNDFCLINSSYDPGRPQNGGPSFCGVECNDNSQCPNGYDCGGVVLLTQDQCTQDAECGGGGRQCIIGEGELRGFCTCVNNQDCAFEAAPPTCAGSCGGLGIQLCTSDADCLTTCDMSRKFCQNPQGQACNTDADCDPLPLCGPYAGAGNVCITNGQPCSANSECLCNAGTCVNTGRACNSGADCNPPCMGGGCVLGAACAPSQGLLCVDVR